MLLPPLWPLIMPSRRRLLKRDCAKMAKETSGWCPISSRKGCARPSSDELFLLRGRNEENKLISNVRQDRQNMPMHARNSSRTCQRADSLLAKYLSDIRQVQIEMPRFSCAVAPLRQVLLLVVGSLAAAVTQEYWRMLMLTQASNPPNLSSSCSNLLLIYFATFSYTPTVIN